MMNLGDRAKAITAEDLIRRYNLDGLKSDRKAISTINNNLTRTNANVENYVKALTKGLEELQDQVDGNITTWFFDGVPSPSSSPANEWITEEEKINHLGDLYYDDETGYAYRWALVDDEYNWIELKDNDVVEALALANAAKDTADQKRRTFFEQPTTPYDSGDIWIYNGEIYRCIRSRAEGDWNTADWVNDLIYTDDTTANKALTDLSNYKEEVQKTYVTNKIFEETNNSISSTIRSVQLEVSKKNTIFREQPTTPYIVGDVYIQNEKIYICKTAKEEGEYSSEDWELNLDATQYATKTQIQQTDENVKIVAESVSSKVDAKDVISIINVSPEAIELTSNRFSLNSTHLDITKDGSIVMKGGSQENPTFKLQTEDGDRELNAGNDFIIFKNNDSVTVYNLGEDGTFSEVHSGGPYDKQVLFDGGVYSENTASGDYESTYLSNDSDGFHQSNISSKKLIIDNIDILNRFANIGTNIKTEVGTNASGNLYFRATVSDTLQYQLNCFPDGRLLLQKCENGVWSNVGGSGYRTQDMLVNKSDTSPASAYGGTWVTDEIYFDYGGLNNPHTLVNASSATSTAFRSGNFIFVRYQFVPSVDLTDTTVNVLNFNLSSLGCTQFYDVVNHCAFSDGGNCVAMMSVAKDGKMTCLDVIPDSKITAGQTVYGSFVVAVHPSNITARGPRLWQRTA